MKTIDLPSGGFMHLTWTGIALHLEGIGLYFGWFSDLDLIGLQIMLMEWVGTDHFTLFRFQVLYFLFAMHVDAN